MSDRDQPERPDRRDRAPRQRDSERSPRPRDGERPRYSADRPGRSDRDRPRRDGDGPRRDGERRSFNSDRPRRDGERPAYGGDRPRRDGERRPFNSDRPRRDGDRPAYGGDRPRRDGERRPFNSDRPRRDGDRPAYGGDRPRRDGDRRPFNSDRPRRDGDRERSFGRRDEADARRTRPPQSDDTRVPAPPIPEEITARELPGAARNELKTLSKENAEQVARHLVMAGQLIDEDPALAHEHALAASRRAGRVGVVRETVGITAYATGDFALALRELRTYRRISGRHDQIALIVDSERGVGRPDRALEEGRAVDRSTLPTEVRVELAVAMSGARLDLSQPDRALQELDIPELDPDRAFSWSAGLFAARAAVLEELGRTDEAELWRRRAEVAEEVVGGADADREFLEIEDSEIEDFEIEDVETDAATDDPASESISGDVVDGEAPSEDRS